jgi:hypothetical protein
MNSSGIVQKLWNYCNILRDAGLSYGDYPLAWSILSPSAALRVDSTHGLGRQEDGGSMAFSALGNG